MLTSDKLSADVGNSGKTTTMTFRIDSEVMRKVSDEAAYDKISINALVNQILARYIEWGINERRAGMVPVSKPLISDLFRRLSKDEVIAISQDVGKNAIYNIAMFMKGKTDAASFLEWFLTRMKTCSEISDTVEDDGSHTYILKHDLGENWSLYHKTILELIFTDFLQKPIDAFMTDSTLVFTLK